MPLSLHDFPEFQELQALVRQQGAELATLKKRQLRWVNNEQAEQITGLSRRTLARERLKPDTVLVYKEDHGVRYDVDSLIRHNERRAAGRGRLAPLLLPGLPATPNPR